MNDEWGRPAQPTGRLSGCHHMPQSSSDNSVLMVLCGQIHPCHIHSLSGPIWPANNPFGSKGVLQYIMYAPSQLVSN